MTSRRLHPARSLASVIACTAVLVTAGMAAGAAPAGAFGSTEMLGQNSEHQHITESLGKADPLWEAKSLQLVAGSKGNYGGVAAPDRMTDSSATPLTGLGPGYKHCDDGDWLSTPGYPQSEDAARAELEKCARYYQYLLDRAVRYAGQLVTPDMKVNAAVFEMTSGSGFAPDSACAFRFSMAPDRNPKCDVLNAFGRSLHLAEDVWSHTNWGDLADPAKPQNTPTNPPGLGNTEVPDFLRYPGAPVIPDGLISGCDDSVPVQGPKACKNRVAHSVLAKDNGTFNPDGGDATSTDKYARGLVVVDGVSNFARAIAGARKQVASTWSDLQQAIVAKYGEERGNAIIAVLRSDSPKAAGLEAVSLTDEPLVRAQAAPASGEFAADPAQDAPLGSGDKATDEGHAGLEVEAAVDAEASADAGAEAAVPSAGASREAAGTELGAESDTTAIDASPAGDASSSPALWAILAVVAVAVVVAVIIVRRRRTSAS